MDGSFLVYLDILIGFSLVMLLASSLVTVLAGAIMNVQNYRSVVLKAGLTRLLQRVDGKLASHAESIVQQILLHPLVVGQDLWGKPREGCVVQREAFVRILLELASAKSSLETTSPDACKALRKALELDESDGETPRQWLNAIQERITGLEVELPSAPTHLLQARAILENASNCLITGLMSWFDETSARMTQYFTQHARGVSLVVAALVAFALPLDSLQLLQRLSMDQTLRNRLVQSAQKMEAQVQSTVATDGQPVEEVKRLHGELASLAIVPVGGVWSFVAERGLGALGNAIPGIFLSICLMSLGAPFWYEGLKKLLKLRSSLANQEEEERQERRETQTAVEPVRGSLSESEAGELEAPRIAARPGTEG